MVFIKDLDCGMECILSKSWAIPDWRNWLIRWRTKLPCKGNLNERQNGCQNYHKVQQNQMPSPVPQMKTLPTAVWTGNYPAGQQLCRKGPGSPCGQAKCEPAMCPCSKEVQGLSVQHQQEWSQQVPGNDSFPLFVIPHLERRVHYWVSQ